MANSADIPVIDLAGDRADVAQQLVNAAEEHGFIYIRNKGLDIAAQDIDGAFGLSKKIFDSPVEEKKQCSIQQNNRGWSGMHSEVLDPSTQKVGDYKEAFNFGEFIDGKAQQPLPPSIANDEPLINAFADSCHNLCRRILLLLGVGLGVRYPQRHITSSDPGADLEKVDDFFSAAHNTSRGASDSILRLLRYPAAESTAHGNEDVRAGAHSDYGSVTLLFRLKGQAGLEILKRDNTWAPVPVSPPGTEDDPSPPILVNIGDLLSYWTNGLFRSTVHRVVFPTDGSNAVAGETTSGARYSIAFFCHPAGSVTLDPVPSDRVKNFKASSDTPNVNPYAERKVVTAQEHLMMRLKATYPGVYDKES